ncbi:unnamed protein product [Calypogeia fissa]
MEEGSHSILSHYDILGAPADAEYAEIRSKYRAAILALHPDKLSCTTDGQSLKVLNSASRDSLRRFSGEDAIIPPNNLNATIKDLDQFSWSTISSAGEFTASEEGDSLLSRFLMVQKAWEVLRDPESRATYDNVLRTERLAYEMKSTTIIGDEIHLREMDCVDGNHGEGVEYSYPCRCGDLIVVSQEELQMAGLDLDKESSQEAHRGPGAGLESQRPRSNSLVLPCESCSMHVRVLFS